MMKFRAATPWALAGALALAGFFALPGSAQATLHGFCSTAAPCADNNTNTPTTLNPPDFGFSAGGHSATGELLIEILVPDTISNPSGATYTISGPLVGASTFTASLFFGAPWTVGDLAAYLEGLSASPSNPIGAFLPSTQSYDPSATGFYVYNADLGTQTLPSNSGASNSDLLTLDKQLPQGSYIVAFQGPSPYDATANSGAILETSPMTSVPEPSTWATLLLGFAGLGFAGYRRAKGRGIAPSIA